MLRDSVLLLALSLSALSMMVSPSQVCPCRRGMLEMCFAELLDADANGVVNATEIDAFVTRESSPAGCLMDSEKLRARYTGAYILGRCDVNATTVGLDHYDFVHPRACVQDSAVQEFFCGVCARCGYEFH